MPHTNNANFNAKRKREAEAGKQKKPAAAAGGGGDKRVHRHAVYQQRAAQKHSRALLRALKKAKGFEQAKLARSLKAAVAAGQPALDIQARQTATKSLETGHLFLKAVEKHKLQALLAHNPKSTVTAKCGGAAAAAGGGGGGADAEAAVAAEQHAVQRVINATAVRKVVEDAQKDFARIMPQKKDKANQPPKPKPASKRQASGAAASSYSVDSQFLSSLAAHPMGDGGYEDEFETVPQRKNRRGQRARRKLAEQKHGAKAAHFLKQKSQEEAKHAAAKKGLSSSSSSGGVEQPDISSLPPALRSKLAGSSASSKVKKPNTATGPDWIPGGGADGDADGENRKQRRARLRAAAEASGGDSAPSMKKQRRDQSKPVEPVEQPPDEKLHPSWQAKRQQSQKMAAAGTASKIKFDD